MTRTSCRRRALAVLPLVLVTGCSALGQARFGMGAILRNKADYDSLDEARPTELTAAGATPVVAQPHWPQYRGPRADGRYLATTLDLDWGEDGPPVAWRTVVGPAYSSVVVAGELAITMEQRRDREAVTAFRATDGEPVWIHSWEARYHDQLSKEGPRATPVIAGNALLALGARGELRCLDLATGELRWRRAILDDADAENLDYGLAASPIVVGDLVLVQNARTLYGIDLATGEPRWQVLDEDMSYVTPVVADVLGRPTVIVATAKRVIGIDLERHEERWGFPFQVNHGLSCTQPMVLEPNQVLASAGYGKGAQLVTLEETADGIVPGIAWKHSRLKTAFNEPILQEGLVYGLDEGVLVCIDPTTGRRQWKEGRYGYGQLLGTGDRLLLVSESGELVVLAVGAEGATELATFPALDGSMNLNLPAVAEGRLFLRNERELVCFDLRSPES